MIWTFDLAHKVLERVQKLNKQVATFECGFGPSGLPHIGTVAEMLRTRMVIRAFKEIAPDIQVQWILFADDLDALRKVPDTIPEHKIGMMNSYIGTSVCEIADPWETHNSYAEHNVSELVRLLEQCGISQNEYELRYSSEFYRSGQFNPTLTKLSYNARVIKRIITHDYSSDRINSYFPFLPIIDNKVINEVYNAELIDCSSEYEDGEYIPHFGWYPSENDDICLTTSIHNGNIKCQWKLDWPMRWLAFDVDFEMHGKDLIGSARVGHEICKLMQHESPVTFMYELFLDENKQKISKSKGNGLEADEWLTYGTVESLEYFLFQNPVKGRTLHWSCIPQYMDMYAKDLASGNNEPETALWHIHGNKLPEPAPVTYNMLLNLAGITDTEDTDVLWRYVKNYRSDLNIDDHAALGKMIPGAIRYYQKFVLPNKEQREPSEFETHVLEQLVNSLEPFAQHGADYTFTSNDNEITLRNEIFNVGKENYNKENLREYFKMLYQVLLGQDSGPQFHQFVEVVGPQEVINMIKDTINK